MSERRAAGLALAGLTLVALLLRLLVWRDGLFGDELYTYRLVHGHTLGDVLRAVRTGEGAQAPENTPPLFYVLAWAAAKLGDPTVLIRLPSVLLGAATAPLVFLIGRRSVGPWAGLAAGCLIAVGPFAIFYSTEARAYATLTFLIALSTLALLCARERGFWWWVYAASTCLALYTHYTAVFVVATQAAWALWAYRDRLRTVILAQAAVALAYLPWVPSLLDQRHNGRYIQVIGAGDHPFFEITAKALPGHPFVRLADLPGSAAIVLFAATLAVAAVAHAALVLRGESAQAEPGAVLVGLAAVATPLGLLAYGLVGETLLSPRNLSASLPAMALLVGWLVTSLRPRAAAVAATAAILAVGAVASAESFEADHRRPDSRAAALFIEHMSGRGDSIVTLLRDSPIFPLDVYLDRDYPTYSVNAGDGAAWRRARAGSHVFLVVPQTAVFHGFGRFAGPGAASAPLRATRDFPGLAHVGIGVYSGRASFELQHSGGRVLIAVTPGPDLAVRPEAVQGFADHIHRVPDQDRLDISGWAAAPKQGEVADLVLAFYDGRLLGTTGSVLPRPDIAHEFGRAVAQAGFNIVVQGAPAERVRDLSRLHVFASVGDRASEMGFTKDVRLEP